MEVLELQFLFMGIIFLTTTCVGLSPIMIGRFCRGKLSLSSETRSRLFCDASCFGAGVFLFVCFLGLLPEADKKFHDILEDLGHSGSFWEEFAAFPWGFFVVTCGFLVIFSIDKFVHALDAAKSRKTSKNVKSLITYASTPSTEEDHADKTQKVLNYECHVEACGLFEGVRIASFPTSATKKLEILELSS